MIGAPLGIGEAWSVNMIADDLFSVLDVGNVNRVLADKLLVKDGLAVAGDC